MTIERISSAEGILMPPEADQLAIARVVSAAVAGGLALNFVMTPGEYDITPPSWTRNILTHTVLVHEDGTATYRGFPRLPGAGSVAIDGTEGRASYKHGGRILNIPADQEAFILIGQKPRDPTHYIFEVLFHRESESVQGLFP